MRKPKIYLIFHPPTEVWTGTEAHSNMGELARASLDGGATPPERVAMVTYKGHPALAVMPWELYESLRETIEVMGDPDAMAAIREAERHPESKVPLEEVLHGTAASRATRNEHSPA